MKHHLVSATILAALAAVAIKGQTTPPNGSESPTSSAPVPLKRTGPPNTPEPDKAVPSAGKYPFTDLLNVLENDNPATTAPTPAPARGHLPQTDVAVPKDFQPGKDAPLSDTAKQALEVGQAWMTAGPAPVEGSNGRIIYTYSAGLPTVVCAPLHVCALELQAGERILGEPHIGDSVRWIISPATSGRDELAMPMIVIKPKAAGLDTDLLITTDRRAYYVRLISKPEEYLARVAFAFPDEEEGKWKAYLARQQDERRKQEAEAVRLAPIEGLESLYFDYTIRGGGAATKPIRVVDDGRKTYIQMPPETAHRELPVLAVLGPDGKADLANYRVKGDLYIVDRIFDRGALILGTGKKAQRADIIRGLGGKKVKGDPFARLVPESVPKPAPAKPEVQK
jgi:type IV secretion system protein TrbG